jgi:hypothetical protein
MPHTGSGGVTTFQADWSASQATGAQFYVYAISANGNGSSSGDGAGEATLSITSGCIGTNYYIDQDGDGYGTSDPAYPALRDCSKPMGYAAVAGDCNDFDPTIHPGATEVCNGKDDNCNGMIDEGLPTHVYCRDIDGDGHGVASEGSETSCQPMTGYGDCGGDCNDSDPTAYLQKSCGVGWCKRNAIGCSSTCTPGSPRAEVCNDFDDDCDGVIDNGTDLQLCGAPGLRCLAGVCVSGDGGVVAGRDAAVDSGSHPPDAGAGSTGGTTGGSGSGTGAGSGSGSGTGAAGSSTGVGAGGGAGGAQVQSGCQIGPGPSSPTRAPLGLAAILAAGLWAHRRRSHRRRTRSL